MNERSNAFVLPKQISKEIDQKVLVTEIAQILLGIRATCVRVCVCARTRVFAVRVCHAPCLGLCAIAVILIESQTKTENGERKFRH